MTQEFQPDSAKRPFSPCISICELEEEVGICRGCGRTMAEISNWLKYDDAARESVLRKLPARLESLKNGQ